jgi:23S rRNA pseudouridine2605 synthase
MTRFKRLTESVTDSSTPESNEVASHADDQRVVPMRLQKFLARAGAASRRGSEDLMTAGRVRVNGETVTELGAKVDPLVDIVTLDGVEIRLATGPVYLAFNKPSGVVTTMRDPQGRPTVAELLPTQEHPGLFPVGRLDFETTGLLLFTTDGELSHRLLHPKWKVPKTYLAEVDGVPDPRDMKSLREGIKLDDGVTAPAQARTIERRGDHGLVEITISEGKKRQVRRMFSAVSHPVRVLHRISFGPINLGRLAEGAVRELSPEEVHSLRDAVEMGE